jgi:hypothetical protein
MAWSGTIPGEFSGAGKVWLKLRADWTVTSQTATASVVNIKYISWRTNTEQITHDSGAAWSQTVDGTSTSGTLSFDIRPYSVNADYVFKEENVTITHGADGTKTAALSFSIDMSGTSAGVGSISGSMELPTIAVDPTISVDAVDYGPADRGAANG